MDLNDTSSAPVEPQSTDNAQQPASQPDNLQPGADQAPPQTSEPPKDDGKAAQAAMQRRINRLTAEKYQERANRERLEQELQRFRLNPQQQTEQQQQPQGHAPEITQELIQREAQRVAAEQRFTEQCNDFVSKGRAAAKDFDTKLSELASVTGPFLNEKGQPEPLLEALLTTDEPHKVVMHLAANPGLAAELADLSPIKQARSLARIEMQMNAKPVRQPSAAPKPLEPVTATATTAEPDPKDTERWIKWRNSQAKR